MARPKRTFHYSYKNRQTLEGGVQGYTIGCKQFKTRTRIRAAAKLGVFVAGDFTTRRGGSLRRGPCPPNPDGVGAGHSWELVTQAPADEPSLSEGFSRGESPDRG